MSWLKFSVWLATAALLAGLSSRMARSQEPPPDRDAAWDGPPGPGPDHQVARPDDERRAGPPRSREDGPPGPPDMRGGLEMFGGPEGDRSERRQSPRGDRRHGPPSRGEFGPPGPPEMGGEPGMHGGPGMRDGRDMRGGPGGNRPRPPQSSRGDFRRQGPPPHEEFGPPGPPEMGGEPGMHGGPGMRDGRDMRGGPEGNRPRPPQSSRGDFRRQGPPPHEEFGPPGPPEMGDEPGMHGGPGMRDGREMRGGPEGDRPRAPQSSRGEFRRQGPPPRGEFGPPGPPEMGGGPQADRPQPPQGERRHQGPPRQTTGDEDDIDATE